MPVLVYTGEGKFKNHGEFEQFLEVLDKIKSEFGNSFERIHVCYNFTSGKQIDVLIISNKRLIDIELKNYEGEVMGGENGPWQVMNKNERKMAIEDNIYIQVRDQRNDLLKKLKDVIPSLKNQRINEKEFRTMINSWACFRGDSKYVERPEQVNIDFIEKPFFRIVNTNNITENIQHVLRNSKYEFTEEDIDSIIKALGLKRDPNLEPPNPSPEQRNATQYTEIIKEFEKKVKQEKLDLNKAKDWIFQLSLNRYRTYTPLGNMEDFTELKFLVFIGIIEEVASYKRKTHIYEYFYHIKNEDKSMNLAKAIIDERIEERKDELCNIIDKYEKRYFLVSMLRGEFEKLGNTNEFFPMVEKNFDLTSNYVPTSIEKELKWLSESLGIDEKLLYAIKVAAYSPQMAKKTKELFEELLKLGLGAGYSSEVGYNYYSFPVSQLLKKLDLENTVKSINIENLMEYATWQMVKSMVTNIYGDFRPTLDLELLKNKLRPMGIDDLNDLKIYFKKLFEHGNNIISNPEVSHSRSEILIFDRKGFLSYCDEIMAELIGKI